MDSALTRKNETVPWLVYPPSIARNKSLSSFNMFSSSYRTISVPSRLRRWWYIASSKGWLLFSKESWSLSEYDLYLFNPKSGTQVKLPPLKSLPTTFRLSSPPKSSTCLVAVTLNRSRLLLCRPGDFNWTPILRDIDYIYQDILFQDGILHALVNRRTVDDRYDDRDFDIHRTSYSVSVGGRHRRRRDYHIRVMEHIPDQKLEKVKLVSYLVEVDNGELLVVQRKTDAVTRKQIDRCNVLVNYGISLVIRLFTSLVVKIFTLEQSASPPWLEFFTSFLLPGVLCFRVLSDHITTIMNMILI